MGICKQMTSYYKLKQRGVIPVTIRMTQEEKAKLDKAVSLSQQTQNAFINDAIYEKIGDLHREREHDGESIT